MSLQEAVFILHQHDVVASYWLNDFEHQVRRQSVLAEVSAEKLQAAYVQIGSHHCAEAIVLFEIPVTNSGTAQGDWYMPLRRLADSAGRGPNMGAGRIKLACRSQCSISWHADSLWEPVTSDFMAVRKALRDNRLSTVRAVPSEPVWQAKPISAVERVSGVTVASSSLAKKHADPEVEELKRTLRTEVDAYRNQLAQLQQEIERQRTINEQLSRQSGIAESHTAGDEGIEQLKQLHRQQIAALETEIEQQSIDRFVSRMAGFDAVLVVFHPGVGQLNITPDNMKLYADNPVAYAAQSCFVGEDVYINWLDHYENPRCQQCQEEIPRVEQPRDFDYPLSAFCKLHKPANPSR